MISLWTVHHSRTEWHRCCISFNGSFECCCGSECAFELGGVVGSDVSHMDGVRPVRPLGRCHLRRGARCWLVILLSISQALLTISPTIERHSSRYSISIVSIDLCGCRNLTSSQLTGSMSPAIGQLTSLVTLDLSNNAINGPFPSELGRLKNLQVLYVLHALGSYHCCR